MSIAKKVMGKFYRKAAGDSTRLPWHQEQPARILVDAVAARGDPALCRGHRDGPGARRAEGGQGRLPDRGPVPVRARPAIRPGARLRLPAFLVGLGRWGKRLGLDWRPIGPRRRSQATIENLFAPELRLLGTEVTDMAVPLPFGPMVRGVGYHFARTQVPWHVGCIGGGACTRRRRWCW